MYLISTGDGNDEGYGYINLFELSGDPENPDFTLLGSVGVAEPWENWSYENHGDFLPQKGSNFTLNSVDARMHTMIYRNNKLWAVHHIYLPVPKISLFPITFLITCPNCLIHFES